MKTVWVTGALGFIGQHLTRRLANQQSAVFGIGHGACPPEVAGRYGLQYWINGELDSYNLNQLAQRSGNPDIIFHLAGGSSVGASLLSPTEDFRRSVTTTNSLLEWIRTSAPEAKMVMASSAAVYGNTQINPIVEDGLYTPFSPYGFHKRAAELVCESYSRAFGLQIAIVRLFSVYGPGLRKQLLWDFCNKLQSASDVVTLHGTGNEIRDWLYIDDAVALLSKAAEFEIGPMRVINGGTGIGTSIQSIVEKVRNLSGSNCALEFNGVAKAGDPFSLVADTNASSKIGFAPNVSLAQGLQNYVHWFRSRQSVS